MWVTRSVTKVQVPARLFIWRARAGRQFLTSWTLHPPRREAEGQAALRTVFYALSGHWGWDWTPEIPKLTQATRIAISLVLGTYDIISLRWSFF